MTGDEQLRQVVEDLGRFVPRLVFVGGLVLPLYLQRPPMFRIRPTNDADAVVACASHADYVALQAELRRVGAGPLVGDDLEDILTLIACRPGLAAEVAAAPPDLRGYIAAFTEATLAIPRLDEIIEGNLGEPAARVRAALAAIGSAAAT